MLDMPFERHNKHTMTFKNSSDYRLLFSIVFSLGLVSAHADTLFVKGQTTEATIFRDRAMVTLRSAFSVPSAGEHEVVLQNLPLYIDPQSIQVRGTGDFTILAAAGRQNFLGETVLPPKVRKLQDSLDEVNDDVKVWNFQRESLVQEHDMLMANKMVGGSNTGLNVAELVKATDFFRQRSLEIKSKIHNLEQKLKEGYEESAKLTAQLSTMRSRYKQPFGEIAVSIRATGKVAGTLNVSFLTSGASWAPIYDLRAKEDSKTIELVLKAQITQNTGMDWKAIRLTLSSGQPGLGAQKPEISPISVYFEENRPMAVYGKRKMAVSMDMPTTAESSQGSDMENMALTGAAPQAVMVDNGGLNLAYTLEQTANLPSSPQMQTVEIRKQELPAILRLAAAPLLDQDVFAIAIIRDYGTFNLLRGQLNVFYDGTYTGQSYLPASTAQDSLVVSLGRDRKVLAKRESVPSKESKNFFGNEKRQAYQFEITLKNNRKDATVVRLEDRVPISRNGSIVVDRNELTGGIVDEATGKVIWDIALTAGQSKKIILYYTIKYPKDKRIQIY